MKTTFLWLLSILAVFLYVIPAIRCFCKRIGCAVKLRRLCRRLNCTLEGTHALWFLGSRRRKGCDVVIGTPSQVFAVKLFGVMRGGRTLVIRESGEYFFRRHAAILLFLFEPFDGAFRPLPEYDFSKGEALAKGRIRRDILLLNPIPMEVHFQPHSGQEFVTGPGDNLFGVELASLSHLMRIVENAARGNA
ncbi:MAG: hypothetical protein IKK57_12720 [Clostridia bacterium]|nr:hypothetical protein [Clostridia bacterium]